MQDRLLRQVPGSADQVVVALVQALEQQGLTVSRSPSGDETQTQMLTVTDADATQNVVDIDPDAATVSSVSISVRQADQGVRVALIDPTAKAAVTDEADLLRPAQRLHDQIVTALDELAGGQEQHQQPEVGDAEVRRALLDETRQTATALGDLDTHDRADTLFVLAKATPGAPRSPR